MRATLHAAPNEFDTPLSHSPSGDHVSCWEEAVAFQCTRRFSSCAIDKRDALER